MARRYDIEDFVQDVENLLRANLNTYFARVEAEQVDAGLVAAPPPAIDDDAYFQFAWNDKALNKTVGVALFATGVPVQSDGSMGLRKYTVDVGVYMSGTQNDPLAPRRLLRASKALETLFQEHWTEINSAVTKEKIETVDPIDFKLNLDSADDCKIAGVTLSLTLG